MRSLQPLLWIQDFKEDFVKFRAQRLPILFCFVGPSQPITDSILRSDWLTQA